MTKSMRENCGWMNGETQVAPHCGIAPGPRGKDVPQNWLCPDCGSAQNGGH